MIQEGMTPETKPQEPMAQGPKKRGGCLTAFLIAVMVINPLVGLYYLLASSQVKDAVPSMPDWALPALIIMCFFNFVCAIAIWNWKKWGFYGFLASSIIAFVVNLSTGIPIYQSIFGLVGLAILFALLRPVWDELE